MFERFTADARKVVADAQQHARRLGHHYIGCEHLLLAVGRAGLVAAAHVLRVVGAASTSGENQHQPSHPHYCTPHANSCVAPLLTRYAAPVQGVRAAIVICLWASTAHASTVVR